MMAATSGRASTCTSLSWNSTIKGNRESRLVYAISNMADVSSKRVIDHESLSESFICPDPDMDTSMLSESDYCSQAKCGTFNATASSCFTTPPSSESRGFNAARSRAAEESHHFLPYHKYSQILYMVHKTAFGYILVGFRDANVCMLKMGITRIKLQIG